MNGKQLFEKYTSFRDFSGSPQDDYAQLLQTIEIVLSADIYPLLEKAEKQNKKLSILEDETQEFAPQLTIDAVILV